MTKTITLTRKTRPSAIKLLNVKLDSILKKLSSFDSITSNINICCSLIEDLNPMTDIKFERKKFQYTVGTILDTNLILDTAMTWGDNRIIIKNGDDVVCEITVDDPNLLLIKK